MPREAMLRKWKLISPPLGAAANFSHPLDCNFFNGVYNVLASLSDLTNPPIQYSVYVENRLY